MLTDEEILKLLNQRGGEFVAGATRCNLLAAGRRLEAAVLRLARKESNTPCEETPIDLLREARGELMWWINEHGCCAGHEGDLIDRIDAVVDVTPSTAAPRS